MTRRHVGGRTGERGQASVEYLVVCAGLTAALWYGGSGQSPIVLLATALRDFYRGFSFCFPCHDAATALRNQPMNKAFLQRLRAPAALSALLAVLAGVAGIVGARHYLTAQAQALQREFSERYATRSVVVAARDLLRGERLEAGSMAVRLMPARFLPSGSLGPEHASGVGGRRLERNLKRGDPILADALASSAPSTLARKLRPGLRAITFVVDEVNSFANLLNAGDVIDLYYSHDAAGQTSALSCCSRRYRCWRRDSAWSRRLRRPPLREPRDLAASR